MTGTHRLTKPPAAARDAAVDSPSHYKRNGVELVDVLEAFELGCHEAQAVQYLARAKFKGEELQDLKKARWWIDRRIAQIARQGGDAT